MILLTPKKWKPLIFVLLLAVGSFSFVHLFTIGTTENAIESVSSSLTIESISILEEREPLQALIVAHLNNPTNFDVFVTLDDTYAVTLDDYESVALLTSQNDHIIEEQESLSFHLLVTLPEEWPPSGTNLTVIIEGEFDFSLSYLWVTQQTSRTLQATKFIDFFD